MLIVSATLNDVQKFLSGDGKPVGPYELTQFWNSCSDEERDELICMVQEEVAGKKSLDETLLM